MLWVSPRLSLRILLQTFCCTKGINQATPYQKALLTFLSRYLCKRLTILSTHTVRPNGITDRKIIFELIMHFMADTDTDENYFGINFS